MSGESTMAAIQNSTEQSPRKNRGMLPALLGLLLSMALGGGGFFVAYSGLLDSSEDDPSKVSASAENLPSIEFVPVEPMIISLSGSEALRHLRFEAQLEVIPGQASSVEALMPRILDVLNGYLRAVTIEDIQKPTALLTLRAQMLRRVQLVVGDGRVNDLLVTEFVLN